MLRIFSSPPIKSSNRMYLLQILSLWAFFVFSVLAEVSSFNHWPHLRIALPDVSIHLRYYGSGPPLMLVHGFPEHSVSPSYCDFPMLYLSILLLLPSPLSFFPGRRFCLLNYMGSILGTLLVLSSPRTTPSSPQTCAAQAIRPSRSATTLPLRPPPMISRLFLTS
jgi:hypothetical protein